MASSDKHKAEYKDNKRVFNSKFFNSQENYKWKVTIIFYAAIHLIESAFPNYVRCTSHEDRYNIIEKSFSTIIIPYDNLYKLSRKARYKCINIKETDVKNALVALKKIEDDIA